MKKIIILTFLTLFFGCSQKSDVISLPIYQANGVKTATNRQICNLNFEDKRTNKSVIATIKSDNGDVKQYLTADKDLKIWFLDALNSEFKARGINVGCDNSQNSINISFASFKAQIQGFSRENMSGSGEIFITIKKDNTTFTKRVSQTQSEFSPLMSVSSLNTFIENLLKDLVLKTAEQIDSAL